MPPLVPHVPPAPRAWVTDGAGFISRECRLALNERLDLYAEKTGNEVVVWIGDTTHGASYFDWTFITFNAWGIGKADKNNGVVLFVFASDGVWWITVGLGLEDRLTDQEANAMVRTVPGPHLRAGDRDAAIRATVEAIILELERPPKGAST